jgi:nucleoside 2-deoxyribosyltransferase
MRTVYLGGPITGCTFAGCTDWRQYAIQELSKVGIKGLSPMRAKDYLINQTTIEDEYDDTVLSCQKGITARDRWDTLRCDVMLANLAEAAKPSLGTVMEIAWADSKRTPIILVMKSGNPHDHSMIREVAGFIVPTLDEALDVAKAILV